MSKEINFSDFFKVLSREDDFRILMLKVSSDNIQMAEKVYLGLFSRTERKRGRPLSVDEAREVVIKICDIAADLKSQKELGPLQILDKTADIAGSVI